MGLFDKFKKKKETHVQNSQGNELPFKRNFKQIITENNIKFTKNSNGELILEGLDNLNNRQEAEYCVIQLKQELAKLNLEKVNVTIMNKDIPLTKLKEDNDKAIDEAFVKYYGTPEEKEKLRLLKDKEKKEKQERNNLREKYEEAHKQLFKLRNIRRAIELYENIINDSKTMNKIVYLSYYDLTMCYRRLHEYDNAIEIGKRKIEALKEANQDYTHAMRELEISIRLKQDNYLSNLKKESESLYYCNQFDEALPLLKEAIELGTDRYQTFKFTSHIYIIKKDLAQAIEVLKIGIDRINKSEDYKNKNSHLTNDQHEGLNDILENINHKLEFGVFKWDCLPYVDGKTKPNIKKAKSMIKEGQKQEGIKLLEELMQQQTFNNTVYNTLYQTYKKDKEYDEAIRICNKAIEDLGYFSKDRFEKWNTNLERVIKLKEKEINK